jgi:hypothetical protein
MAAALAGRVIARRIAKRHRTDRRPAPARDDNILSDMENLSPAVTSSFWIFGKAAFACGVLDACQTADGGGRGADDAMPL